MFLGMCRDLSSPVGGVVDLTDKIVLELSRSRPEREGSGGSLRKHWLLWYYFGDCVYEMHFIFVQYHGVWLSVVLCFVSLLSPFLFVSSCRAVEFCCKY